MKTRVVLLVVIGFAAAGSGTTADTAVPERRSTTTTRNFGIGVAVPAGWDSRMFLSSASDLPEVHVASYPLPENEKELEFGKAASRVMGTNDVRVRLMEVPSIQVGTQGFNRTSLPITIRRSDLEPSRFVPRDHAYAGRRFAVHGRPFSLGVEFGRKPPTAQQLKRANRVVSSLAISPRPELDPRQWRSLRRPLHLPRLAVGAACPRSSRARVAARISSPLGRGPAYPSLGSPNGVADLTDDLVKNGWYLHKTLWAISPRYRGPVLIRGARLDGSGVLRFNFRLTRELRRHKLAPTAKSRWRYMPSQTALRAPGCYAFQVDGIGFSRVVVFAAEAPSR